MVKHLLSSIAQASCLKLPSCIALLALTLLFTLPTSASPLDDKIKTFSESTNPTPAQASEILKLGLEQNRSLEAFNAVKRWLTNNPIDSPQLLQQAAQAAERAGEGNLALGFYRKLLGNPAVDANIASQAVPAAWRLLINHLGDTDSAYQWMAQDGNRLRAFGRAHQFDSWFIAEAFKRNDLPAIARRLAAIHNGNDPLESFASDLEKLHGELETYQHGDDALFAALRELAAAKRSPATSRARLEWVIDIIPAQKQAAAIAQERGEIPGGLWDAPLKSAAALVNALPYEGSIITAEGWMHFNAGDSGVFSTFVNPRREEKAAPILAVMPRLTPAQIGSLLGHSVTGGKGRIVGQYLFSNEDIRVQMSRQPEIFNSLSAPPIPLIDPSLTEEQVKAMAPHLARNPHLDAALIRAHAAGARTASTAMARIMEQEAWRITDAKPVIQAVLRSHLFENDAERAALEARHAKLGQRHEQLAKQVAPGGDANRYQSAFNELLRDLKSNAPKIPGALALWNNLFKNATDEAKIPMLRNLLGGIDNREQEFLFHRALANALNRISWQANTDIVHHFRYHRQDRELVTPLLQTLADLLRRQMQEGTLSETHFGMWLFAADYQDDSQRQLMAEIANSPAYLKLNHNYRTAASNDLMFGPIALTPRDALSHPHVVSAELLALPENANPGDIENALARVVDRASKAPATTTVIGLQPVANLETWSDRTLNLVLSLFSENAPLGAYPTKQGYDAIIVKLTEHLTAAADWRRLEPHANGLWHAAIAADDLRNPHAIRALRSFAEKAIAADLPDIALALTRSATSGATGRTLANSNENAFRQEGESLRLLVRQAGQESGIISVTVDPSDPAYPIYQSQSEWLAGNLETAYNLYSQAPDPLIPTLRDLSVDYTLWLLQRLLDEDENQAAEVLVRELTIWSRQAEGTFTAAQDAGLRIAFADLSFRKGNLPTARAWYRQVADTATLRGTPVHLTAALGSVRIDRVSRNFSAAITELDALMRIDDPTFRLAAQSARAEVLMDQENFAEALREIEAVLRVKPKDSDALILQAQIQYQMRKLVEASEIEIGPSVDETVLVPGEPLKINLRDPSLSVSGLGADIEIEVWTTSGDRERVLLAPFGDSRERLRAEIPTALGAPTPGDRTLQILGNDEIRFGYSKEFRQRMKDLPADPDTVITVASDATLAISAGGYPPRQGERRLSLEELGLSTAQAALGARSVRPGNPIYIRLTDPDQSKTTNPDTIRLTAFTSSGDEIRNLELIENGPFSGEFEAVVPTATAPAMATASESAPGRDPNTAISTKHTNGWLGAISDSQEARLFTVDLNDDAAVDQLTIQSGAPGDSLTHFALLTSMNGIDWTTRARFPAEAAPWDGRPQISSFPTFRSALTITPPTSRELPADWLQKMEVESVRPTSPYLSAHIPNFSAEDPHIVNTGHPGYSALIRFRATFHQPAAAIRRFQLEGLPFQDDKETIQTLFLLNGTPASEDSENPHTIERELSPGLHTIEVWHHGSRSEFLKTKPRILQDIPGQAELTPVPDEIFDPATFPEAVRAAIAHQASITPSENGQLDVQFHPTTRARLIRLAIFAFEGLAPRIDRITLTDREKTTLLPIDVDFMALRQNDTLEVLPGDTITVRYEDPVSATPKRKLHEQRLQAAYNDGTIAVSFLTYETNKDGERVFVPQPIRRFRFDDALTVLIDDADLDTTPERDTIEFTVTNSEGTSITLQAVESGENTGSFMGRFFPVEAAPTRASEIQLTPGASLTITYRDNENLTPGIPTDRTTTINHALYQTPTIAAYGHTTEPIAPTETPIAPAKTQASWMPQPLTPRRAIDFTHHADSELPATTPAIILGASLRFDIVASHLALTHTSEVPAFVQTESARKAAGITDGTFNINVPGTLRLTGTLKSPGLTSPPGYTVRNAPIPPTNAPALEEGRFAFSIPVTLGPKPARSYANREARDLPASEIPATLATHVGETIHIGYPWQDPDGKVHWKTASFRVESHAFLDVMDNGFSNTLESLYIGERAYIRLTAPGLSKSDQNDTATVSLTAANGTTAPLELYETEPHSGVFTGSAELRIATETQAPATLPPIAGHGFPVQYGDTLTITHADQSHTLSVSMGANGEIEPFTKRFTGDEMAVQTSFVLAESYFELAKKHNEMDEESLARRQIGQAHRLLAEAVANYHDENLKAHAEYLLGNLAMEFAELAKNEEAKTPMYQDALARFILIADDFPDSEFAPKAQLKIAQTYELMGEISSSIEEYVKLAYKYPDHELIPTVMARLGSHFQKTGQGFKEQADPLREKQDPESIAEVIRLDALATAEFLNAANVYSKLERRFPEDPLAGISSLAAAQNYMRAHRYNEAIAQFQRVIDNQAYDGASLRSQAIYWAGLCHERLLASYSEDNWRARGEALTTAYQLYRRVTFDFPDSNWAKFARGRLADPAFERLVKEEAEQRARMIEEIKEQQKNRRR